jgi:hypothetical protein
VITTTLLEDTVALATEYDHRPRVRTAAHPERTEVRTSAAEVRTPAHPGLGLRRAPLLWGLVIGAGAVALVAMAASSFTLAGLGTAIGWVQWKGWLAWSLPISVDLLAAVAGVAWLAANVSTEARNLARWITIGAVTSSVALNAVAHLVESGDLLVEPWLRITVSTVPPIVAAVALHLVVTVVRGYGQAPAVGHQPEPERDLIDHQEPQLPIYEHLAEASAEVPAEPVHTPLPTPALPVFTPAAEVRTLPEEVPAEVHTPAADPWSSPTTRQLVAIGEALRPAPAEPAEVEVHTQPEEVRTHVAEVHTPAAEGGHPIVDTTPEPGHTDEWWQAALTALPLAEEEQAGDDEPTDTTITPEIRRELILGGKAEGLSQRETARIAKCSPSYVRKVWDTAA